MYNGAMESQSADIKIRVIRTYQEAWNIGRAYLKPSSGVDHTRIESSAPVHLNALEGPWEISEKALKNTLDYVLKYLHHPCYMLCVRRDRSREMFKLDVQETAPQFKELAQRQLAEGVSSGRINAAQEKHIRSVIQRPFRVMQCIIKPLGEESTISSEYEAFASLLQVPAGVYLLNLTDAVLVEKEGKHPWPMSAGGEAAGMPKTFLPVLSLSGGDKYWDIPIPNYDDVQYALVGGAPEATPWNRKIAKAVFRGGASGCGYTPQTNPRLRLVKIAEKFADIADVGLVSVDTKSIKFDPAQGLGMMNTGFRTVGRMTMQEQSRYRIIIHVDGNVAAYRLLATMATGSLIVRVKSAYTSWADTYLIEDEHYVSVREDMGDLESTLRKWLASPAAEKIATEGARMAAKLLTRRAVIAHTEAQLSALSERYLKVAQCAPWSRKIEPRNVWAEKYLVGKRQREKEWVDVEEAPLKVVPKKLVPRVPVAATAPAGEYMKTTEKERCRAGYKTDPKNKMRCITSTRKAHPASPPVAAAAPQKPPASPVAAPQKPPASPVAAPQNPPASPVAAAPVPVQAGEYMKTTEKEKCRAGYKTDPKNKLRCITSTRKAPRASPVAAAMPSPKPPSPFASVKSQFIENENHPASPANAPAGEYMKTTEKEKCRTGYKTDPKNKMRCITATRKAPRASPPSARKTPRASPQAGEYMKTTEKEKCRTGYKTNPKNKMQCIPK